MRRVDFPPPPAWSRALATVGVTGTNGKTTTTAWVAAALRAWTGAPVVRVTTVGAFVDDEPLDVPATYDGFLAAMRAGLDRGGRAAAIELTSEALGAGFATAWPVRVGVFTNLTHDHLDAHGSPEHYLASKAQLFVRLPADGAAVLNGHDPVWELLAEVSPRGARKVLYGAPGRAAREGDREGERAAAGAREGAADRSGEGHARLDLEATRVTPTWRGTLIEPRGEGLFADVPATLRVSAIGEVYAEDALAAIAGAVSMGAPARVAAEAIAAAPPPPGRFEVVSERPYLVVDYAHSPDALERVVRTARRLCAGELTVVFGAGGERDRDKRAPMGRAARAADRVIVTNDNPRREDPEGIAAAIRAGLEGHGATETVLDRGAAIAEAVRAAGPDDVVLVAGRGHETSQAFADGPRPFSDVLALRRLAGRG